MVAGSERAIKICHQNVRPGRGVGGWFERGTKRHLPLHRITDGTILCFRRNQRSDFRATRAFLFFFFRLSHLFLSRRRFRTTWWINFCACERSAAPRDAGVNGTAHVNCVLSRGGGWRKRSRCAWECVAWVRGMISHVRVCFRQLACGFHVKGN